ncbi:MAG: aminotransferase class I/II-fold pyridoxal phosphate-dependent enzyme [Cyanobacteria bacterium P01_H01_bin.74]
MAMPQEMQTQSDEKKGTGNHAEASESRFPESDSTVVNAVKSNLLGENPIKKIRAKKAVEELQAYHPPLEGRRDFIRLDFNENTSGFIPHIQTLHPALSNGFSETLITAYPEYLAFTEKLAKLFDVSLDQILMTNGSDEALFVIPYCFIEPGEDVAITTTPTFALIPHNLKLAQSRLIEIPYTKDFQYDEAAIEEALTQQPVKLAVFASPDNPVGAMLDSQTVARWCQQFPETVFLIDEAYAEYAGQTALPFIHQFHNILVTRTFSKAWGLAGLRLGIVFGHPDLIKKLLCVRSPYSINNLAVHSASQLLPQHAMVLERAQETLAIKDRVIAAVKDRGYSVVTGHGNFFLIHVGYQAAAFCNFMRSHHILVRDRSSQSRLWGMVRVSVGSATEMDQFIATLDAFYQKNCLIFDMDGTLVDTSQSFDVTVAALVEKYSGQTLDLAELTALRAEGGFNDDWDATLELLRRRGIATKQYNEIAKDGTALYLSLAAQTETWLIAPETLTRLKKRYRLAVATGRYHNEFDAVWKERFSAYFDVVVCQDSEPGLKKKPASDIVAHALHLMGAEQGVYIGNSVDDMAAAKAVQVNQSASVDAIGISTTMPSAALRSAGASLVIDNMNVLGDLFVP